MEVKKVGQVIGQFNLKFLKTAKGLATLCCGFAAFTVVVGLLSLHRLKMEYSVMQFLPAHHPALVMDSEVRKQFHLEDRPLFIGVLDLKAETPGNWLQSERMLELRKLTEDIKNLDGVVNAISVANVAGVAGLSEALVTPP